MTIVFETTEISGLTAPTYDSAAANKYYVDQLSGSLSTHVGSSQIHFTSGSLIPWLDSIYEASGTSYWTSSNGLWYSGNVKVGDALKASIVVANGTSGHPTDIGYYAGLYMFTGYGRLACYNGTTYGDLALGEWSGDHPCMMLKSDAKVGIRKGNPSYALHVDGTTYSNTYSGSKLGSSLLGTGDTQAASGSHTHSIEDLNDVSTMTPTDGDALVWDTGSSLWSSQTSDLGDDYKSGWAYLSSNTKIPHGYGSQPPNVQITPSGSDTFSYSCEVDNTDITVYISSPGKKSINWRAGGLPRITGSELTHLNDVTDVSYIGGHVLRANGAIFSSGRLQYSDIRDAPVSGGGAGNLSTLTIDTDKDWNSKGIHNLTYLSSQTISGGHMSTGYVPTIGTDVVNKDYVDSKGGGSGQNYAYDYLIYKEGSDYKAQDGINGNIYSNSDASTLIQSTIDKCGMHASSNIIYIKPGYYHISSTLTIMSSNICLYGAGEGSWNSPGTEDGATIFKLRNNCDIINISSNGVGFTEGNKIKGIKFYNGGRYYGGTAIYIYRNLIPDIINCSFNQISGASIFLHSGCYGSNIINNKFQNDGSQTLASLHLATNHAGYITSPVIKDNVWEPSIMYQIYLKGASSGKIINNYFEGTLTSGPSSASVYIDAGTGYFTVANNSFYHCSPNASVRAVYSLGSHQRITNNWISSYAVGVEFDSYKNILANNNIINCDWGAKIEGSRHIVNNNIFNANGAGGWGGCVYISARKNLVEGNSIYGSDSIGIRLTSNLASGNLITNNIIDDDSTGDTDYCIREIDGGYGTPDYNIYRGNICRSYQFKSIHISGTHNVIKDNEGYVTENSGWAYVSSNVIITHGCATKPTNVSIVPSGTTPIAYSFTVDSTNITVYHTSPTKESFSWEAKV